MKFSFAKDSNNSIPIITFASEFYGIGALAHLARAFDWQSRGDEFESRMLHMQKEAAQRPLFACGACGTFFVELFAFHHLF